MSAILKIRKTHGLSQSQLALKLGVDKQNVSNWERGITGVPTVHFKAIKKICSTNEFAEFIEDTIREVRENFEMRLVKKYKKYI